VADLELDVARHDVRISGRQITLSALEFRLLAALLDADERVLPRDRLLDAIHGQAEGDITDRAIDVYVKRLREKLGDDPVTPRYVATVRGVGYRAAGPVERRAATT
jgi:DNA-binding response OmpR family regulator